MWFGHSPSSSEEIILFQLVCLECPNYGALAAAIAQWIRLRLPSCGPGFESQAQHLSFGFLNLNCGVKRTENKRGRDWLKNYGAL